MHSSAVEVSQRKQYELQYDGIIKDLKMGADPGDGMLIFERGKKGKYTPLTCLTCLCMPVM